MAWHGLCCPARDLRCILPWCAASVASEALDEVTVIGEAGCDGNFGHRSVAIAQQLSGELDATPLEIPHRRHAGSGSKLADEMKAADSSHSAQFIESDMLGYVIVHVTYDRSKSLRVKRSSRIV